MNKQSHMFNLIESWHESDQKIHDFCRSKDIKPSIFYYWRKKYDSESSINNQSSSYFPIQSEGHQKNNNASLDSFQKIEPIYDNSPLPSLSSNIDISLPSGVFISLPVTTPLSTIQAIIKM